MATVWDLLVAEGKARSETIGPDPGMTAVAAQLYLLLGATQLRWRTFQRLFQAISATKTAEWPMLILDMCKRFPACMFDTGSHDLWEHVTEETARNRTATPTTWPADTPFEDYLQFHRAVEDEMKTLVAQLGTPWVARTYGHLELGVKAADPVPQMEPVRRLESRAPMR